MGDGTARNSRGGTSASGDTMTAVTSLADLEAHRADYHAVLATLAGFQSETRERFEALEQKVDRRHDESIARFNAIDEQLAEIKDLVVDLRG